MTGKPVVNQTHKKAIRINLTPIFETLRFILNLLYYSPSPEYLICLRRAKGFIDFCLRFRLDSEGNANQAEAR